MKRVLLYLIITMAAFVTHVTAATPGYERVYCTQEQALDKAFPTATRVIKKEVEITPEIRETLESQLGVSVPEGQLTFYVGYDKDHKIGIAVVLDELGKHRPITFMTVLSCDFKVRDIVVMVYRESHGNQVRKRRFLKQFFHKSKADKLVVDADIDGISGATVSSWAIAAGVKKALVLAEVVSSRL